MHTRLHVTRDFIPWSAQKVKESVVAVSLVFETLVMCRVTCGCDFLLGVYIYVDIRFAIYPLYTLGVSECSAMCICSVVYKTCHKLLLGRRPIEFYGCRTGR